MTRNSAEWAQWLGFCRWPERVRALLAVAWLGSGLRHLVAALPSGRWLGLAGARVRVDVAWTVWRAEAVS